jgi:short-subunit dehydrogenase
MGRRVVITGGSSGIGAAVATKLTARGDTVAICARRVDRLAEVDAARRYGVDVGDAAAVEAFARDVEADLGGVDVVINNAGASRRRPMHTISLDEFTETVEVNFWSAVRLTHHLLPGMLARNSGTIVNVSSMGTRTLAVRTGAYTAAKGALNHYTEALYLDLVDTGVTAKLFIPGATATEFSVPKAGNDDPFPFDPAAVMTADAVADALIAGLETDQFEYFADPAFSAQSARVDRSRVAA